MTRKEQTQAVIDSGDIEKLRQLAIGYRCACKGSVDDEPACVCEMNSRQVRSQVSLAALERGKLVRLK